VVDVKNGVYVHGKECVLGCGVPDDNSTELKITWLKDEKEIKSDDYRVIAVRQDHNYSYSTLSVTKIGNNTHLIYVL